MVWNGNPLAFVAGNTGLSNAAPALLVWATEDGTIAAWQGGLSPITEAVTAVPNPGFVNRGGGNDPVYKGLAIGTNSDGLFLYATNFRSGKIAVWDNMFAPATALNTKFIDSNILAGFAHSGLDTRAALARNANFSYSVKAHRLQKLEYALDKIEYLFGVLIDQTLNGAVAQIQPVVHKRP